MTNKRAYYPTKSCFIHKVSLNKKNGMCEYCYSCYEELCHTLSERFNIHITENDKSLKNGLEYIYSILRKKEEHYCDVNLYYKYKAIVKDVVNILNKYTKYSYVEQEGYNLLHKEFIDCIMPYLDKIIIGRYCWIGEQMLELKFNENRLKKHGLYLLNIICLESYCDMLNNRPGGWVYDCLIKLYELSKET